MAARGEGPYVSAIDFSYASTQVFVAMTPRFLQVLIHVTERVATLHAAGVVHRDLKPGNVLWRPRNHAWTLIDYGCAAEMGVPVPST